MITLHSLASEKFIEADLCRCCVLPVLLLLPLLLLYRVVPLYVLSALGISFLTRARHSTSRVPNSSRPQLTQSHQSSNRRWLTSDDSLCGTQGQGEVRVSESESKSTVRVQHLNS